jgi:hypothetical protein
MIKVHNVQKIQFIDNTMFLHVDGKKFEINIADWSERLAKATQEQREKFDISPSGYGIHWPDLDEDLSIDGLIGVKHSYPDAKIAI